MKMSRRSEKERKERIREEKKMKIINELCKIVKINGIEHRKNRNYTK